MFQPAQPGRAAMKISDVKVSLVAPKDGLIAFASVVLESGFYVGGIAVHEKLDGTGYRLTYPTRKAANQTFNICHPITREASKVIERAIFQELKNVKNQGCKNAGYHCHQFTAE